MTDTVPEARKAHPYFMYDMLKETGKSLDITLKTMESIDYSFLKNRPLVFTGNGTAYHAAQIGSGFLIKTGFEFSVIQSYELLHYTRPFYGTVVGISNSGKTKSTVDSMIFQKKYAYTAGVTHYFNTPLENISDIPIIINSDDKSLCNTKSFFDNVIASMYIASKYAGFDPGIKEIVGSIKKLLDSTENYVRDIAHKMKNINRIFVLGAGPQEPVAREAAQKIKEASHIFAEGIELEEFIHGCTSLIDENSLLIIISSKTVNERSDDIVRACRIVGTKTFTLNGTGDFNIDTPDNFDEYTGAVLNVVPLYYLAYYLALEKNVNPDLLRFDEEKYREFDNIVFPPGAH